MDNTFPRLVARFGLWRVLEAIDSAEMNPRRSWARAARAVSFVNVAMYANAD